MRESPESPAKAGATVEMSVKVSALHSGRLEIAAQRALEELEQFVDVPRSVADQHAVRDYVTVAHDPIA